MDTDKPPLCNPPLWLDLQLATNQPELCPSEEDLLAWCVLALGMPTTDEPSNEAPEVTVRIVDNEESQQLNNDYRGKNQPTNVLSFPFEHPIDLPAEAELSLLGDLVICLPKVIAEAAEQQKPVLNHWAHLVIHGMLHLQGYDHETDQEAELMESLEIKLLAKLGISNPYISNTNAGWSTNAMNEDRSSRGQPSKNWFDKLLGAFSAEPRNRLELLDFLKDASERQLIANEALTIIEGALQLSDMQVGDVMIPRSHMIVVKIDQHPREFLSKLIESAHSRFPVIGETSDEVLGILLAKDLLPLIVDHQAMEAFDIRQVLRQVAFVPEYKGLYSMLREFRETHNHMAIVVDEYGGTAGLVTIEDVLEEIVGDIEDEHDVEEEADIRPVEAGNYLVKALTPIEDFNDYFHCDFSDEEFDTLSGILMQKFGHLPRRGEAVVISGFEFTVINADNRRIRLLQVRRLNGDEIAELPEQD